MVLGLLVAGAAGIIFLQAKRSYVENEQVSRIQENGRYALKALVRDISMAGFLGEHLNRATIDIDDDLATIDDECGPAGWYTDLTAMLQLEDGPTGDVVTEFPCITSSNYRQAGWVGDADTDAIAIKRVADAYDLRIVTNTTTDCDPDATCCVTAPAGSCNIDSDNLYLQTNNVDGLIYDDAISASSITNGEQPPLPREDWKLLHRVYFIRPWSISAGDNMPTLCRMRLVDNDASSGFDFQMQPECFAEGVENMQIEIGLDTNNDRVADTYTTTPTTAQMNLAVTARIFLLVRGTSDLRSIDNQKTYNLGSTSVTVNDSFYRRVFSTNVQLRNLSNLNALGL